MDSDGDIKFLYKWGQRSNTGSVDAADLNNDVARAINYDDIKKEIVVLMEVTSPGLRPNYEKYGEYSKASSDLLIVTIKTGG